MPASAVADLERSIDEIAARWRADRVERQTRRHLDRQDFDLLRDAGLLKLAAPRAVGGLWESAESSARTACELYRRLGSADPSVALVSCMHPAVIAFWLSSPDPSQPDWEEQRRAVFASAAAGEQWGTITSEPGSGGDISRTRATASPVDTEPFLSGNSYAVTGDKHFGSGFGINGPDDDHRDPRRRI
jgi:alkylation response protein AidB-like acyl-CoA dehydrogenase